MLYYKCKWRCYLYYGLVIKHNMQQLQMRFAVNFILQTFISMYEMIQH